jgi:hypothetical protein
MVLSILQDAKATWQEITKLARPADADKPVLIGSNKKSQSDIEAHTDNKRIYINLNDEQKFKKNFETIVLPAYKIATSKLYDVKNDASDLEALTNLMFDTFLFVHFHEQMHPWLCPNSRFDEKTITRSLYDGVKKAEPHLSKAEAMYKVNNCKNLIWDFVLNVSFVSKTSGFNNDSLEEKISYVFTKNGREIEYQPVTHYPSGILPILYMTSAHNNTTDIPISLVGGFYTTLSYNDSRVRKNALDIFLSDLSRKGIKHDEALDILQNMYAGIVADLGDASKFGIDVKEYKERISRVTDLSNSQYEDNQKYFISTITKIFDTPSLRYNALKGFVKVLSPYISISKKQGSPDPNTNSGGSGDEGQGSSGSSGDESDDGSSGKTQDEMDQDSMGDTLDDLMGTLDGKEADGLLGEVANDSGAGSGKPSSKVIKRVSILAADEYYKKHADIIEVRNPSEENISYELGSKKIWKLVNSSTLTAVEVSKLNYKQILNFQKATGLPILMELGNGYYRLNQYREEETPLKSYTSQKTGIEIPDNWVLLQDSSGSMTTSPYYVGSKNKFDLLNRVKYGLEKGLYEVCKEMRKDLQFGVVDFSDATFYRGLDSLVKIYEARNHPIKVISLSPQCKGTECNSQVFNKIEKDLKHGKTIYTFITDGDLQGDVDSVYRAIERVSSIKDRSFVFVEIGETTSFGQQIKALAKGKPSVLYYRVSNVQSIKDKLSSVLIKYN